jgi:adhesin transport system outer membrane protein
MKIKHVKLLTGVSFVCLCMLSSSHSAKAESISDAVLSALNYHPSVEAAMANRDALVDAYKEEYSGYFPEINVRGVGGRIFGDNSTTRGLSVTRGSGYSDLFEGSVTLTQKIFDGWETESRVDAASARRKSANLSIYDVREELALSAVISYLDILRTRESLVLLRSHKNKIEDYQERIARMVEEGAADQSMVMQAKDVAAQLENTIIDITGQLETARSEYKEITGHAAEDPMSRPEMNFEHFLADMNDAVSYAIENHPTLGATALEAEAVSYDADAETASLFPDVNGELSYLKRDQEDVIGGEVRDAKAVVRFNWNFSTGGGQIYKMRKARKRYTESQARYQEQVRMVEKDVRAAWYTMETAQNQLKLARERVTLNKSLFEINEQQFEAARMDLLQIMQSHNTYFNSRMALLNAEFRYLASQYTVLANTGRLQEAMHIKPARSDERNG